MNIFRPSISISNWTLILESGPSSYHTINSIPAIGTDRISGKMSILTIERRSVRKYFDDVFVISNNESLTIAIIAISGTSQRRENDLRLNVSKPQSCTTEVK